MEMPELGSDFQAKYRLHEVLGEGGFARVYRAEDIGAQRIVALKVLKPHYDTYTPDTVSRFNREVKVIARLRDPHTVTMFDFGRTDGGLLYMVFEYVPGSDLSKLIKAQGPLGDGATIYILTQVLQSLREAHHEGLLHRDIKPENIRVYEYMGDPLRVTLLDFGIAKPVKPGSEGSAITHSGSLVGTPQYMSPEQLLEKELTPASDIYSLGLVAFEMLTGESAIKGNSLSDQLRILAGEDGLRLPLDARVSPGLRRIVDRMISRDPATRLQTAEQVLRSLDALGRPEQDISYESAIPLAPLDSPQPTPLPGMGPVRPPSHEWSQESVERSIGGTEAWTAPQSAPIPVRQLGLANAETDDEPLSNRFLGLALAALLTVVAFTAWVLFARIATDDAHTPDPSRLKHVMSAQTPPPPPPSTVSPEAQTRKTPTPDDDKTPAPTVGAGSRGCGLRPPIDGLGRLQVEHGLVRSTFDVYIPPSYNPNHPHPVMLVFHDTQQEPLDAVKRTQMDKLALEMNWIVFAPKAEDLAPWWTVKEIRRVMKELDELAREVCIDPKRIYAIGHGAGGRIVEKMQCREPRIRATVTTAFRSQPNEEDVCHPARPVPHLHFAHLGDKNSPPEGGIGCSSEFSVSIVEHDKRWQTNADCDPADDIWFRHKEGTCKTWNCAKAPYVSCQVEGGREWPGTSPRTWGRGEACDGKPGSFPFRETIRDFFVQKVEPYWQAKEKKE